jgi:hypothetical protein
MGTRSRVGDHLRARHLVLRAHQSGDRGPLPTQGHGRPRGALNDATRRCERPLSVLARHHAQKIRWRHSRFAKSSGRGDDLDCARTAVLDRPGGTSRRPNEVRRRFAHALFASARLRDPGRGRPGYSALFPDVSGGGGVRGVGRADRQGRRSAKPSDLCSCAQRVVEHVFAVASAATSAAVDETGCTTLCRW